MWCSRWRRRNKHPLLWNNEKLDRLVSIYVRYRIQIRLRAPLFVNCIVFFIRLTGLLVEPNRKSFLKLLGKNRKALHINSCLSSHSKPQEVEFVNAEMDQLGGIKGVYANYQINHAEWETLMCCFIQEHNMWIIPSKLYFRLDKGPNTGLYNKGALPAFVCYFIFNGTSKYWLFFSWCGRSGDWNN